jgi:hypothetical protein
MLEGAWRSYLLLMTRITMGCGLRVDFGGLAGRLLLVVASMNKVSSPAAEEVVDGVASLFALFLGRL